MNDKVIVTSMVGGNIGITLPHIRFNKTWPRKGTKLAIEKDILREAIYEPGVEYLFKQGILYIDDLSFKIELGLEPEGAETPTHVAVDEKYMTRVLKVMPVGEMKKAISEMNEIQRQEFVDFASSQNDISLERIKVVDQVTGANILKIIELKRLKEE